MREMDPVRDHRARRPATVSGPRAERQPLVLPPRPVTAAPRRHTPLLTGTIPITHGLLVQFWVVHISSAS